MKKKRSDIENRKMDKKVIHSYLQGRDNSLRDQWFSTGGSRTLTLVLC